MPRLVVREPEVPWWLGSLEGAVPMPGPLGLTRQQAARAFMELFGPARGKVPYWLKAALRKVPKRTLRRIRVIQSAAAFPRMVREEEPRGVTAFMLPKGSYREWPKETREALKELVPALRKGAMIGLGGRPTPNELFHEIAHQTYEDLPHVLKRYLESSYQRTSPALRRYLERATGVALYDPSEMFAEGAARYLERHPVFEWWPKSFRKVIRKVHE